MMREVMPEAVTPETDARLSNRVNFHSVQDGFALSTIHGRITYAYPELGPFLSHMAARLREGGLKAGQIAIECLYMFGQAESVTLAYLNDMFRRGVLAEKGA